MIVELIPSHSIYTRPTLVETSLVCAHPEDQVRVLAGMQIRLQTSDVLTPMLTERIL
jgi:hypothetical protein